MPQSRPLPVSVAWRTAPACPARRRARGAPSLPSRAAWLCRLEGDQPAAARRRLSGCWLGTTGAPIRAALPLWENRCCDPRSPCAYVVEQDEDGVWCASAQLRRGGRRRPDGGSRGRRPAGRAGSVDRRGRPPGWADADPWRRL